MGRSIRYATDQATRVPAGAGDQPGTQTDDWKDKVSKLIPAEVVTFYLGVAGIIKASVGDGAGWYLFTAFVLGTALTPVYLRRLTSKDDPLPTRKQYVITTLAFVVWALATSAPLKAISLEVPPLAAALLLPIFTFVVGAL